MSYLMIVSFPLDLATMRGQTDALIECVGREYFCGSGAGFGTRDVEFEFADADAMMGLLDRIGVQFPGYDIAITKYTEDGTEEDHFVETDEPVTPPSNEEGNDPKPEPSPYDRAIDLILDLANADEIENEPFEVLNWFIDRAQGIVDDINKEQKSDE